MRRVTHRWKQGAGKVVLQQQDGSHCVMIIKQRLGAVSHGHEVTCWEQVAQRQLPQCRPLTAPQPHALEQPAG